MPELPELEVIRDVLRTRVVGKKISHVELVQPTAAIVVRDLVGRGLVESLTDATIENVMRRGKFLIFDFDAPLKLVVNPKLSGRLQLANTKDKRYKKTAFLFAFDDDNELRYYDDKAMGQVYLADDVTQVPDFAGMGPEPFEISREEFCERLRGYRGEIKGVLTRGEFIAGIGNAYADEILWHAQLHPYRKRTQLTREETDRLYDAIQETLRDSIEIVRVEMGEKIHLEPRNFFKVHMRTGEPCLRCGTTISEISANQRITNFCRRCQPGGLVRGM